MPSAVLSACLRLNLTPFPLALLMGEATGAQTAWGTPYGRFDEGRRPGETGHNGVVNPVLDTSRFHHFKLRI